MWTRYKYAIINLLVFVVEHVIMVHHESSGSISGSGILSEDWSGFDITSENLEDC